MARILIIDDDEEIRGLLRRVFEREGYEITEAPNGSVGTQLYRDEPADLVITDIIMPEKDGWETIVQLRKEFPQVKCIGISGGAQIGPFSYLMIAKRLGAVKVFTKPLNLAQIVEAVKETLETEVEAVRGLASSRPMLLERKSILLVDPDAEHAWTVCEALTWAGHSVTDTKKPEHAIAIMGQRSFEVAIIDVLSTRFQQADLIRSLRASWTHPIIIAMADFESSSVRKAVISRGADHLLGKPVDIDQLLGIISPPPGFSGRVDGVDILEYLQFLLLSGKKVVLEIRPAVGDPCRLYLRDGAIVHAVCGAIEGEAAFFRCINFRGGEFVNLPWTEPDRVGICRAGEFLLMEAARRRDEAIGLA